MFSFILNIWTLRSIFWPIELFSQCSPFAVVDIFWFVYSFPKRLLWTKKIEHVKCFVGHFSLYGFFGPVGREVFFVLLWVFWHFLSCSFFPKHLKCFVESLNLEKYFLALVEWGPFELLSGRFQSPLWHHNNSLCLLRHISKLSPIFSF